MNLARNILLSLAVVAVLGSGGCALPSAWQGRPTPESRNAELGSGLRPPSQSSGEEMLGLDPRAREIEKNLGL